MTPDDSYEAPFDTDTDEKLDSEEAAPQSDTQPDLQPEAIDDDDLVEAKQAWSDEEVGDEEQQKLTELAQPFVGQWNTLISTTNWEKGRIISEWREALIESGVDATQYSDEAWSRRVGGVTAPHVGRLRRVYDRFGSTYATYNDVYWSHFLAALDWEDAPMWLEGASREDWSVSQMREQRWQANGAVESERPTKSQIVEVDVDEDITLPAQGGGREKDYGDEPSGVAAGPRYDEPDFGDEEELSSMASPAAGSSSTKENDGPEPTPVQPFVGLPQLPDDMTDAVEDLKLCILRHKSDGWRDVNADDVQKYLDAIGLLLTS